MNERMIFGTKRKRLFVQPPALMGYHYFSINESTTKMIIAVVAKIPAIFFKVVDTLIKSVATDLRADELLLILTKVSKIVRSFIQCLKALTTQLIERMIIGKKERGCVNNLLALMDYHYFDDIPIPTTNKVKPTKIKTFESWRFDTLAQALTAPALRHILVAITTNILIIIRSSIQDIKVLITQLIERLMIGEKHNRAAIATLICFVIVASYSDVTNQTNVTAVTASNVNLAMSLPVIVSDGQRFESHTRIVTFSIVCNEQPFKFMNPIKLTVQNKITNYQSFNCLKL